MHKNLYFLICFIISFAFFIPAASALTEISAGDGSNQAIVENSAPSTIFDGPPATIFDGPPATIFDGPPASVFDTGSISSQSSIEQSQLSLPNASNSQSTPIEMQKTGLPLPLIILAILLVFGGFMGFIRK